MMHATSQARSKLACSKTSRSACSNCKLKSSRSVAPSICPIQLLASDMLDQHNTVAICLFSPDSWVVSASMCSFTLLYCTMLGGSWQHWKQLQASMCHLTSSNWNASRGMRMSKALCTV